MNIQELKNNLEASAIKIRETKRAIKSLPTGSFEQSQLQTFLHYTRIQNRADYLAYSIARGQSLRFAESKVSPPENDCVRGRLQQSFWKALSNIDSQAFTEDSAHRLLDTHLGK